MKELLIIRSVSFQQLDMSLKEIIRAYPGYRITLLTHEHGVKLAEKYREIDEIIVYPYQESFSYFRSGPICKEKNYDVLIVPVTNITGAGFSNVFQFSLTVTAKQRVLCNLVSQLKEVSYSAILFGGLKNAVFSCLAGIVAGLFAVIAIPQLLYYLPQYEKKKG